MEQSTSPVWCCSTDGDGPSMASHSMRRQRMLLGLSAPLPIIRVGTRHVSGLLRRDKN